MLDLVLALGKIVLVLLLFVFLFLVMRTGVGLVKGQTRNSKLWQLQVVEGGGALKGSRITLSAPIIIGRSIDADIIASSEYVSARHTRIMPPTDARSGPVIQDLGSTNGSLVNGVAIELPTELANGDEIFVGDVEIQVKHLT